MNYNNNQDEITWESIGNDLLFHKNKFEFGKEEKELVKKLLIKSPPPLEYRRKVSYLLLNYLVMDDKFWCSKRNV
jgi:hypothetical protein